MTSGKTTVLLTGCGGTPAQNIAWALRQFGDRFRIVGAECDKYKLWLNEGFEARYLVPRADHEDYIGTINDICDLEHVKLIHAQPDPEVKYLSAQRDLLRAPMFLPSADVVVLCHDKFAIKEKLTAAGVGTAKSVELEQPEDVDAALSALGKKIWVRAVSGAGGRGALPIDKPEHGRMWVDYWNGWGSFIAEEYLPGRNLAWQGVYNDGELIGSIAWERLQYVMPTVAPSGITGTPAVSRLINDDQVHEIGRKTIAAVDPKPNGVYGIDMKGNVDGVPYVTEINPGRFFQPSFIYAQAGYFLVRRFFELALGLEAERPLEVRARVPENLYWTRGLDVAPVLKKIDQWPDIGDEA